MSSGTSPLVPDCDISDTPGAYSLLPISDEERVARDVILAAGPDSLVIHVVDAKNLRRMLPMTLELLELGLRVILVLNMMDEARRIGVEIETARLGELLGIPVVETVAATGEGVADLCRVVRDGVGPGRPITIPYETRIVNALRTASAGAGTRVGAPRWLASDEVAAMAPDLRGEIELNLRLARQRYADRILSECAQFPPLPSGGIERALNRMMMNMWTGVPFALAVLYFGVYRFVGGFGAGTLVNFLENDLYDRYATPWLTAQVERIVPWPVLQDLFVHDYGILTLGLRYAVALILPVVGTYFLLFSVLEDSGYLPRLALMLDRVFKKLGLNGRAVIPIILGFGCGTMATLVTRILETRRERIIATLLLGFAIPCSAQLGVVLGMLSQRPAAFAAWCAILAVIFLTLGVMASRKLPGEAPAFYLEMPPLRMPRPGNVLTKTYARMHWYFLEILPLFLAASVVIWLGHITGLFHAVLRMLEPVVAAMGLPADTASALLFGFFRRDYGAAGLFDMQRHNLLDARQVFVSVLVISLFLPCVAQFFVMKKERGWRFALLTSAAILLTATAVGILANAILVRTGWMG